MRQFTEHEETRELVNELEANDIEYSLAEQNKIFIDVFDGDEISGVWKVQWYDYWSAFKMVYFVLEDDGIIKSDKTVAFSIEQVIENVLG